MSTHIKGKWANWFFKIAYIFRDINVRNTYLWYFRYNYKLWQGSFKISGNYHEVQSATEQQVQFTLIDSPQKLPW